MTLDLVVQQACEASVPGEEEFQRWVGAALVGAGREGDTEIALRVVDEAEMAAISALGSEDGRGIDPDWAPDWDEE